MEELKRCPFCGGEAETRCSVAYAGYVYDGYVECLECGSRTPIYYTKAEAIAAWNRRVTQNIGEDECWGQPEEQEG
jgi:Lar family restriction alleviation protein